MAQDLSKVAIQPLREQTHVGTSRDYPPAFTVARPQPDEYAPYYDRYISLVQGEDILNTLDQQRRETMMLLSGAMRKTATSAMRRRNGARRKFWATSAIPSAVFAYRALRISRADATPLEGFEQDDYVRNGPFAHRPLGDLVEEFIAVRRATLSLLRNLDEAAWMRRGIANKNEVSVRAIAYIIAGHELHHRRILEEKYFAAEHG